MDPNGAGSPPPSQNAQFAQGSQAARETRGTRRDDVFERVVREHGGAVWRLALAQTRNRADAEDVFQEVFAALVRRMAAHKDGAFASQEHLRAWLLRATVDRSRDVARAARRRAAQSLDELPAEVAEGLLPCPDDQACLAVQREEALRLWRAVGALPPKLRAAVHLFYVEEMSCEQIAAALNITTSAVTSRLTRARKQLGRALKEDNRGKGVCHDLPEFQDNRVGIRPLGRACPQRRAL